MIAWHGHFDLLVRNPRFTSNVWKSIHRAMRTKLKFNTAFHSQANGLYERIIQTLEDMFQIVF